MAVLIVHMHVLDADMLDWCLSPCLFVASSQRVCGRGRQVSIGMWAQMDTQHVRGETLAQVKERAAGRTHRQPYHSVP